MVKFWRMLIAMLAMMAMVVVPTSCGDDDDDENGNGSNVSSNSLNGKVFVDESEDFIVIYVFDKEIVSEWYETGLDEANPYQILSNGLICFDGYFYKYKNGKLYYAKDGVFVEDDEWVEAVEDKTGRTAEQIIKEWKAAEKVTEPGTSSISVTEGTKYSASAEGLTDFTFKVISTAGHYFDKSQVVALEVEQNGKNYKCELSDAGTSYLMWTKSNGFETVGKRVADENAWNIVMVLACANSTADYTITSATVNTTLANNGAIQTLFKMEK